VSRWGAGTRAVTVVWHTSHRNEDRVRIKTPSALVGCSGRCRWGWGGAFTKAGVIFLHTCHPADCNDGGSIPVSRTCSSAHQCD
jgi:hypothetical protein